MSDKMGEAIAKWKHIQLSTLNFLCQIHENCKNKNITYSNQQFLFNEKITSRRTDYKIETKIKLMLSRAWPCFSINLTNRASGLSFGMFRISRHPSINHLETQLHLYIIKSAKCRQIYHTCILWETKNMATF